MLNEPGFVPSQTGWIEVICGGMIANFSQRIVENDSRVLAGETDAYEPGARHCFRPPVDRRRGEKIAPAHSGGNSPAHSRGNSPAHSGGSPSDDSVNQPPADPRNHSPSGSGGQSEEDNPKN